MNPTRRSTKHMLARQSDILRSAQDGGYAVGSFDVISIESAIGVIDAVEKAQSPAVLAVSDTHLANLDFDVLAPAVVAAAKKSSVPIVVHLDHARTLGLVARALGLGFTSVMYDGDGLPWERLLEEIRVVSAMAHDVGAVVEGALSEQSRDVTGTDQSEWTLPSREFAEEFVAATNIDVLAIGDGQASFDVDRVAELSTIKGIFTSLHGGSKLSDEQLKDLVSAGVAKCSVFSKIQGAALARAAAYCAQSSTDLLGLGQEIRLGYADGVSAQIARFGSANHG